MELSCPPLVRDAGISEDWNAIVLKREVFIDSLNVQSYLVFIVVYPTV